VGSLRSSASFSLRCSSSSCSLAFFSISIIFCSWSAIALAMRSSICSIMLATWSAAMMSGFSRSSTRPVCGRSFHLMPSTNSSKSSSHGQIWKFSRCGSLAEMASSSSSMELAVTLTLVLVSHIPESTISSLNSLPDGAATCTTCASRFRTSILPLSGSASIDMTCAPETKIPMSIVTLSCSWSFASSWFSVGALSVTFCAVATSSFFCTRNTYSRPGPEAALASAAEEAALAARAASTCCCSFCTSKAFASICIFSCCMRRSSWALRSCRASVISFICSSAEATSAADGPRGWSGLTCTLAFAGICSTEGHCTQPPVAGSARHTPTGCGSPSSDWRMASSSSRLDAVAAILRFAGTSALFCTRSRYFCGVTPSEMPPPIMAGEMGMY